MTTNSLQVKDVEVHVEYVQQQEAQFSPIDCLARFFVQVMHDQLNEPIAK